MNRSILLPILVALGTGAAIGLQGPMNSLLTQSIGLLESTFIVLLSGAVVTGLALLAGLGNGDLSRISQAPPISLAGGVVGILIITGVVYTISKLGVAAGVAVALIAQLTFAATIDHFGLFGVEKQPASVWTFAGIALLVAGAVAIRR
ncbi:MAG: DMT family transporter [Chloroflexota bacterium]|nr:DMT family transporter [Chloroflexota bacterium]